MNPSPRRPALGLGLIGPLVLLIAACAGPSPTPLPATPVPDASPAASPSPIESPDQGNVGGGYPELAVEERDGYIVTVTDPEARAWRFDVRGLGLLGEDRLEVIVEVGDITPGAEGRIHIRGALVDVIDMNGMVGDSTVAAGGCHPTLHLCVGSDGLGIDPETGAATLVITRIEPGSVAIQGATADWPGEPFVLGPWRTTEPYGSR